MAKIDSEKKSSSDKSAKPSTGHNETLEAALWQSIKEQNRSREKKRAYWHKGKNQVAVATLLLLAVYTGFTIALWRAQQTANGTSAAAFIAANRPWVAVSNIRFLGPLTFNQNGDAYIYIAATATNFGHSPTVIHDYSRLEVVSKNAPFSQFLEERNECNLPAKQQEFPWFGHYLLPNGTYPYLGGSGQISHTDYANAWPAPDDVIFRIVGCVDYTFPSDSSFVGETGYSADVTRIVDSRLNQGGFDPKGPPISMNMVVLTPTTGETDYVQ